jgi:hypothetical protein
VSVAVIVMTDGRLEYLKETVDSFDRLQGDITTRLIHDDTGDTAVHVAIRATFPGWHLVTTPGRSGFGGAYRHAREHLRRHVAEPWILSTEDDMVLTRTVNLHAMCQVMEHHPNITQMALRRQAWSGEEIAAGGVVELAPNNYVDRITNGHDWLEHRQFFTTNTNLTHRRMLAFDWPEDPKSEAKFAHRLFGDDDIAIAGYWGKRSDRPWIDHIGVDRHPKAKGY